MKPIKLDGPLYKALARIAEHEGVEVDAVVNAKLTDLLKRECHERIAAREGEIKPTDTPYVNQCSESFLRQICGDQWELCWWAAGCWSLP